MTTLTRPDERKVYCKLLLSMLRLAGGLRRVPDIEGADALFIIAAVVLAAIEGKPFRSQKLSQYLEMPRTTLLRRIDTLIAEGSVVIGPNGEYLPGPKLCDPAAEAVLDSYRELLFSSAEELRAYAGKIDIKGVHFGHKDSRQDSRPKVKTSLNAHGKD